MYFRPMAAGMLALGLTSLLVACGGGSETASQSAAGRSGTVGILLTDMPASPDLFESINATIERVELLGGDTDDGGRVTIYSGPAKTFDLLRLRHESIPLAFQDDVPTGEYCKIRLTLSDLELVLADDTPDDSSDNEIHHPRLPGNGKLDLVVRDCFSVGAGEVVTLQLDLDAGNSIHIVENNNGFNFRPVIFVDVLNDGVEGRLLRLEGVITEIDEVAGNLLLCEALPSAPAGSEGCVQVNLGDDAAFFDNVDFSGAPRPIAELLVVDRLGQTITVVGRPGFNPDPYLDIEVPDGQLPPVGMCRLWVVDLPPGEQAAPIDCDDVPAELPANTILVTHEGVVPDPRYPWIVLDTLVVELGEFLRAEGTVATDADTDGFNMAVSSGGPVISGDTLGVLFQPGEPGVNGTRVVTQTGVLLTPLDVVTPLAAQVDGVEQTVTGADPVLNAALVIVDNSHGANPAQQVTGLLLSVASDSLLIDPDMDTVCGQTTNSLQVDLADDFEVLTVVITDTASEITPGGILVEGQNVGMNGHCTPTGYIAQDVVVVDDQRL